MASLCKFPCFLSLPPHKLFLTQQQQQEYKLSWKTHEYPPRNHFRICAYSTRKSRGSRKVKSNVELCNDIREFVSAVGLPEGHVPSMKELSEHGRNDLANIVRRRGYKFMRDLLTNSTKADVDGSNIEKSLAEWQDAINDHVDLSTGQRDKMKDAVDVHLLSTEVHIIKNQPGRGNIDPEHSSGEHGCMPIESSVNSSMEEKALDAEGEYEDAKSIVEDRSLSTPLHDIEQQDEVQCMVENNSSITPSYNVEQDERLLSMIDNNSLSTEVPIVDNYNYSLNDTDLNSKDNIMPIETSANFSLEESALHNLEDQDGKANNMAEGISSSTGVSNMEYYTKSIVPGLNFGDHSCTGNSSLEEKVAKFIQTGDLDDIEDNAYGILEENGTEESNGSGELENSMESRIPSEQNFGHTNSKNAVALALNGSVSASMNDHTSAEGQDSADQDKDFDIEIGKGENRVEINHLKFMLYQKELELSNLKEQIEKEKLALSALQAKTKTEISKAQNLLSEKDADLLAAEESLSGLVEVKLTYYGDGEIVEVTGSFNGWHHRIKMDPELPSRNIIDPILRKTRLWSTTLWLYPGVYEIKFIVDGHWRIDPQRESITTRGGICNNILRVHR